MTRETDVGQIMLPKGWGFFLPDFYLPKPAVVTAASKSFRKFNVMFPNVLSWNRKHSVNWNQQMWNTRLVRCSEKTIWKCPHQWFSHLRVYKNHLEDLLKHRWLGPLPTYPAHDSVAPGCGLRMYISTRFPGDSAAVTAGLQTPLWDSVVLTIPPCPLSESNKVH